MLLIVDDDPTFLESAELMLDTGKGVFFARDTRHAKDLLGCVGALFSVALVDLDLPGQDGFSLIREMRTAFPDLPVIATSGVFQRDVLESAKLLGAVDALWKPIDGAWTAAIARARANGAGA